MPLLGIYLKELKPGTPTGTITAVFIAALFTVAGRRKQPRCPSTEEWINKIWDKYAMGYNPATQIMKTQYVYKTDKL